MKHRTSFAARFFGLNILEANSLPELSQYAARFVAFQREHAHLSPKGDKPAAADGLCLSGIVATRSFQGLVDEYAIDIAPGISIRVLDGSLGYKPGEVVDIFVENKDVFLLQG